MAKSFRHKTVDASRFAMVPKVSVPRSAFDVVSTYKTTFDGGHLIPVYVDEILPGDSFRVKMTAFTRLATPITPVMDNLTLESFFFFVPNRLVWDNWERFMGEQVDPTDTTQFLVPYVEIDDGQAKVGTIANYFGINVLGGDPSQLRVSALPFRAYNRIYNDWFRDQDLQLKLVENTDDGPDAVSEYFPMRRGKRHDYFTTARPWPAKPLNTNISGFIEPFGKGMRMVYPQAGAPVSGIGVLPAAEPSVSAGTVVRQTGFRQDPFDPLFTTATHQFLMDTDPLGYPNVRVLINDLRTANAIQIMMEQNARGGTRYSEIVRDQFGVTSPDARLQRTEYLGGGRAQITVSPVAQTSASGATGSTTVLGELAGVGTAVLSGGFSSSFTEHGYVIGLVCVQTELTYQNGTDRHWFRRSVFDFYRPALANLGEQAIMSKELYTEGTQLIPGGGADELVFGYQERWAEYKYKPGRITGRFQSHQLQTLDMWHFAQNFAERPVLNNDFVVEDAPIDRVLQVGGMDHEQFLFDSVFDIRRVRCMPMFSIPGLGPRL